MGDSGYFNNNWLLTPVFNTRNLPENGVRRYLRRFKITRRIVECAIGVLKEEFPCLNHLRLKSPSSCAFIILMCITLHNIQNEYRYNRHEEHDINMIYNIDDDDDNNNDDDIMDHDDQENNMATFREIIELFENE